jgi:outer membrane protein
MQLSRVMIVRSLAISVLISALTATGWAQAAPNAPQPQTSQPAKAQPHEFQQLDYSRPRSFFPNIIGPYTARQVPQNDVTNSPRLENLIQSGKLMLSMDDAVALALENNLDIAIARYNMNIADTDILRAKAGASILGGNFGVVQNTPGGGVGGLSGTVGSGPGGTTVGQAGAGAGLGGLVTSTLGIGPQITSFDPILTGTLQSDHLTNKCTNFFCGTQQNTGTVDFAYSQGFITGTNMTVGFNNQRSVTNNRITTVSPALSSSFRFTLTQHLLQGFGFAPNTRFIRIAKNNREISDVTFRLQVITTVDQIENMYWNLVYAYENVRVQKESLAFAEKTLSDNKKQVEIGTLAPIEVVRAQSTVASDQQALTLAETNLQYQQLLVKNALSRNLLDPVLVSADVVPTSTMELPRNEMVVPTQDLINDALSHRAELAEARINLTNTQISNKAVVSSLRPSLDLFAYYGGSGLGGSQNPLNTCDPNLPASSQPFCNNPGTIPSTSYGGTLEQLVNSTAPDKGVGLTLNIPLRNRAGQALQVRSQLEYRQAQLRLQQIENQVRIEVRNAQYAVQQNRAAVESAQAAVALARQSLDAEQKKYALGASTTTLVLQNQSALATAESNLVSAMASYEKSRVELDRATGLLLDHTGILISDAQRGQVTHMPTVPFVTPSKEVEPQVMPQPGRPTQPQGENPPSQ